MVFDHNPERIAILKLPQKLFYQGLLLLRQLRLFFFSSDSILTLQRVFWRTILLTECTRLTRTFHSLLISFIPTPIALFIFLRLPLRQKSLKALHAIPPPPTPPLAPLLLKNIVHVDLVEHAGGQSRFDGVLAVGGGGRADVGNLSRALIAGDRRQGFDGVVGLLAQCLLIHLILAHFFL